MDLKDHEKQMTYYFEPCLQWLKGEVNFKLFFCVLLLLSAKHSVEGKKCFVAYEILFVICREFPRSEMSSLTISALCTMVANCLGR